MTHFRPASLAEQAATHLRKEIMQGHLAGTAPGVHRVAADLGVHHTTAEAALRLLEKEGLLIPQGPGRRRLIRSAEELAPPSMRIGILSYEDTDRTVHYLLDMQHKLQGAGHAVGFTSKTLQDLGMDAHRVARFVKDQDVDAWIIVAGPRGVLEWFANQPKPAFSLFGRRQNVSIAGTGPDKLAALNQTVDRLVDLGHRRIVMLLREEHRNPKPGYVAQALLDAMEAHGLQTGPYNLPDWKNNPESLRNCLDSLFRLTPPTAMIIDEPFMFNVAQQHLSRIGILAPQNVSLVCADPDPTFDWFKPSIAHIDWDSRKLIQRVVRWANNVARGKNDSLQTSINAEFIDGGTIGPISKR